ncbi:hypothetical protein [Mycobacteroides abscessus]
MPKQDPPQAEQTQYPQQEALTKPVVEPLNSPTKTRGRTPHQDLPQNQN